MTLRPDRADIARAVAEALRERDFRSDLSLEGEEPTRILIALPDETVASVFERVRAQDRAAQVATVEDGSLRFLEVHESELEEGQEPVEVGGSTPFKMLLTYVSLYPGRPVYCTEVPDLHVSVTGEEGPDLATVSGD